jgi:hypothetical protein
MMWDGRWWHDMFLGPVMMIAFIAVAVVVVVLLVRWLGGPSHGPSFRLPSERDPLEILKERFARGEIDKASTRSVGKFFGIDRPSAAFSCSYIRKAAIRTPLFRKSGRG